MRAPVFEWAYAHGLTPSRRIARLPVIRYPRPFPNPEGFFLSAGVSVGRLLAAVAPVLVHSGFDSTRSPHDAAGCSIRRVRPHRVVLPHALCYHRNPQHVRSVSAKIEGSCQEPEVVQGP
jgi:hypothetical protein